MSQARTVYKQLGLITSLLSQQLSKNEKKSRWLKKQAQSMKQLWLISFVSFITTIIISSRSIIIFHSMWSNVKLTSVRKKEECGVEAHFHEPISVLRESQN